MNYKILAAPNTPEWLALRNTGIGGSEAAAAAGLSEWSTPLEIYARKRGEIAEKDQTDAMRRGAVLEPYVVSEFCHMTGKYALIAPCGMMRHPKHEFVFATPDAILQTVQGDPELYEVLEAKTLSWRRAAALGEEGTDDVPIDWLCQVQQELAVTGLQVAHIAAMLDRDTIKTFRVERNDDLIDGLIDAERELWERIQDGRPPEPSFQHSRTLDLLKEMYRQPTGEVVWLPRRVAERWERYEKLGRLIGRAKERRDAIMAEALHALEGAAAGVLPNGYTLKRIDVKGSQVSYYREPYFYLRKVKG